MLLQLSKPRVLLLVAGTTPFSTQPWNIKGDTLILDVGSLSFQGNHPNSPPLNEQGCADACLRTPGCNAYTFCSSQAGCGSGCKAYTDKNPTCECMVSMLSVEFQTEKLHIGDCTACPVTAFHVQAQKVVFSANHYCHNTYVLLGVLWVWLAVMPAVRVGANPTIANPDWSKLPAVLGFGPWGLTSGCKVRASLQTA